jgi:UDP-N-acetylmuramate dehydrogenase
MFQNENLSRYTWFKVGGNADILYKPNNVDDLILFLKSNDKPLTIIGGGSNLLIRDKGVRGVVILLRDNFNDIKFNDDTLEVMTGVLNSKIYNFCKDNDISGYEFLGTIPGTIGGAIRGNSGCYGSEIKDFLIELTAVDFKGNIINFTNSDCKFEYRKNNLPNDLIFISAKLMANNKATKDEIEQKFNTLIEKRNATQPINFKTAGSTFKNLPNAPAWKIIQELGYQGKDFNGAKMSEKHANFLINTGNSSASDIENLINSIKRDAKEKMNIELELEIKIIGEL